MTRQPTTIATVLREYTGDQAKEDSYSDFGRASNYRNHLVAIRALLEIAEREEMPERVRLMVRDAKRLADEGLAL